jgi:hypothetical protein
MSPGAARPGATLPFIANSPRAPLERACNRTG